MKKIFIMMILAVAAMNINAQLVVDSIGRVGVGTETPNSMLSIGTAGSDYTVAYINADENEYGYFLQNFTNTPIGLCGGQFSVRNTIGTCCGGRAVVLGGGSSNTDQCVIGMAGYAEKSYTSIGVLGAKWLPNYNSVNFAGVYGSETLTSPASINAVQQPIVS